MTRPTVIAADGHLRSTGTCATWVDVTDEAVLLLLLAACEQRLRASARTPRGYRAIQAARRRFARKGQFRHARRLAQVTA